MSWNTEIYDLNMQRSVRGEIFSPDSIPEFIEAAIPKTFTLARKYEGDQPVWYYNIPCSFDIETTSFQLEDRWVGTMYAWVFGINGLVLIGRTWDEFLLLIRILGEFVTDMRHRLVCYVHSLSFDFQFFRKYLEWHSLFARTQRKPIKALCESGIEFRDSFILTNRSLAAVGEDLRDHKVRKLKGFLDYSKPRHSMTPLTGKETEYIVNDALVVMSHIQSEMETAGSIVKIPLTSTGYVRRDVRLATLHGKDKRRVRKYKQLVQRGLTLEPLEYVVLKEAMAGGFTHANAFYVGDLLKGPGSADINSSYPLQMVGKMFPMSKGEKVFSGDVPSTSKGWICRIALHDLKPRISQDFYISISRCRLPINADVDNGRVVAADYLETTVTDVDLTIIKDVYTYSRIDWLGGYQYDMDYLPTEYINVVLDYYESKTTLKGVPSQKDRYDRMKSLLNSLFGMMVTDIVSPEIVYDGEEWADPKPPDIVQKIDEYNTDKHRFLSYPWGVFVCAHARRQLWDLILAVGSDHVYSDTDSDKFLNPEAHLVDMQRINDRTDRLLRNAADIVGFDFSRTRPRTIKGIEKPLGHFEYEGTYDYFKTLGAKRYMYIMDGKLSLTVSGINKKTAIKALGLTMSDMEILESFDDGFFVPGQILDDNGDPITDEDGNRLGSGKLIHQYDDEEFTAELTDYLGHTYPVHERSSCALYPADYELGIVSDFKEFINVCKTGQLEIPDQP